MKVICLGISALIGRRAWTGKKDMLLKEKKQEDTEIERRLRFEEMEKQKLNDSKIRFSKCLTCIIQKHFQVMLSDHQLDQSFEQF